jgi:hypothetical protein
MRRTPKNDICICYKLFMPIQNGSGNISYRPNLKNIYIYTLIKCKELLSTHCNAQRSWQLRIWLNNNIKLSFIIPRQDTLLVITSRTERPINFFFTVRRIVLSTIAMSLEKPANGESQLFSKSDYCYSKSILLQGLFSE